MGSLGLSCASKALSRALPPPWVATEKHYVATPPLEFISRHNVFYRDRNVLPLGKLCHDIRRPLSRPKPGPAPNPIVTLNSCHDTGPKSLCRDREGLCSNPNHPVCMGTRSRHRARKLCRACISAACAPKSGCAPDLRTLSRHRARETLS